LTRDVQGPELLRLLSWGAKICSRFTLVHIKGPWREETQIALEGEARIFRPFLIESRLTTEWPGTIQRPTEGPDYVLNEYRLDAHAVQLLAEHLSLFETRSDNEDQTRWLEDLSLLRAEDDTPWLTTTWHEGHANLSLSEEEQRELVLEMPQLAGILECGPTLLPYYPGPRPHRGLLWVEEKDFEWDPA
jgi:hypothetical protein